MTSQPRRASTNPAPDNAVVVWLRGADPVAAAALLLALTAGLALGGSGAGLVGVALLVAVGLVVAARSLAAAWAGRSLVGPVVAVVALVGAGALVAAIRGAESWRSVLLGEYGVTDWLLGTSGLVLVVAGPVLLAGAVHAADARRRATAGTPWRSLEGVAGAGAADPAVRRTLLQGGVGLVAVLLALTIWLGRFAPVNQDAVGTVVVVALSVAVLLVGPVLAGLLVGARRDRAEREVAVQRQAVAAHLHDSVLQTFALIQRSLDDPERVRRLVRTQERELRSWLAGREVDPLAPTLSAALRDVADRVEEEHGATIELDVLDDPPVLERHRPLLEATREALRNAARHGGSGIRVLAETTRGAVPATVVYVRDDGAGFDPDAVPAERRGVRDAIVGRMVAAGGSARVDTGAGAGTEVVLELPDPSVRRSS